MTSDVESVGDPFAFPAFLISISSGVVGLTALIWNIIAWFRSGHRVTVETEIIVRNPKRDMFWTGRRGRCGWRNADIPPTHVPHCVVLISVIARNKGRTAVDIERFQVMVGKPSQNKNISWTFKDDQPLPQRLEPGSSASRKIMISDVEAFTRREKKKHFRTAVTLGNGKIRRSPRSFNIDKPNRGEGFLSSKKGKNLLEPFQQPDH